MSGTRNTLVSITCIVFSSRRSCMGSQIINRQCLGRLWARQQGLHEADAQQLQLRGLGHPSCDGRASTAGGTFEAELTPSPRAPPGGTISKHPQPRSTVEASLPSAMLRPSWGRQSVWVWKPHLTLCLCVSASVQHSKWTCRSRSRLPRF